MNLKSGVYFVHYDDIPAFVETAKAQGLYFCGDYPSITSEKYKNTYRPFSIDKHTNRMSYWSTERYIEHWQPNQKKVIL